MKRLLISGLIFIGLVSLTIVGFYTGYLPAIRGQIAVLEDNPIKFWISATILIVFTIGMLLVVVHDINSIFARYGGNYNWATFKAILRNLR